MSCQESLAMYRTPQFSRSLAWQNCWVLYTACITPLSQPVGGSGNFQRTCFSGLWEFLQANMDVAVRYWIYFSIIFRCLFDIGNDGSWWLIFFAPLSLLPSSNSCAYSLTCTCATKIIHGSGLILDRPWHIGNKGSWWFLLLHQPLCYQDYHLHSNSPTVLSQKCLNFFIRILCITTLYCVKLPDSATQIFMCWIILAMKGAGVLPIAPVPLLPKLLKRTIFDTFTFINIAYFVLRHWSF